MPAVHTLIILTIVAILNTWLMSVLIDAGAIKAVGDLMSDAIDFYDKLCAKFWDMFIYGIDAHDREFFEWMDANE